MSSTMSFNLLWPEILVWIKSEIVGQGLLTGIVKSLHAGLVSWSVFNFFFCLLQAMFFSGLLTDFRPLLQYLLQISTQIAELGDNNDKLHQVGDYKAFSSPFYYGTTVKIDGSNYEKWFRTVMMSIKGHKKREYIERERKDRVLKYVNWEENNNIVMVSLM